MSLISKVFQEIEHSMTNSVLTEVIFSTFVYFFVDFIRYALVHLCCHFLSLKL